jgi:ubiquinone/menaquinone biosynthesis C-methylase UbiE
VVAAVADLVLDLTPPPTAILDIGCGTGALLRNLESRLPKDVELAGVDPAPTMIEVARAGLPPDSRTRLEEGFGERLPFADDSFDLVVGTASFHHWRDQPAGLAEAARVLRVGGRILLADHFAVGWLRAFNALARRDMRTLDEVQAMLASVGFSLSALLRVFDLGPLPLIRAVLADRAA